VTKATLHDELMRDAGFESDYRELERRRITRRRVARLGAIRAVNIVLFLCAVAGGIAWFAGVHWLSIPHAWVVGLFAAGIVGELVTRLMPQHEDRD
jgi:hypothetical protein